MQTSEWFKDWFDSPYYHILYKHRDDKEAADFIDKLSAHLNMTANDFIWDLACGKGRHSVDLNKKGFNVVGTDLSEKSIECASQNSNDRLEFYKHDMRTPFRINYFTHVFNLFTSIGYFENKKDNCKVFKTVYNSLKDDGIFVLDFFNSELVTKSIGANNEIEIGKIQFKISKRIDNEKIIKEIEAIDGGKSVYFEEKVSLLNKEDFIKFSKESGFVLTETFGDYNLNKFNKENSERLILIFKK